MRVFGFTFWKFMMGVLVLPVFFSTACQQSVAEKNTEVIQAAIPVMLAQKDSLKTEVLSTQQAFEAFKIKIDQTPSDVINKPEYARLSETIEAIVAKSATLNGVIPAIEAKLQALENINRETPTETVQHEIVVLKQLLEQQRGRMTNYKQTYEKIQSQLDSIQSLIK